MKTYNIKSVLILAIMILLLLSSSVWSEDKNINLNVNPSGISDEVIKMRDHEIKIIDEERKRIKAENTEESNKLSAVGDTYYQKSELDDAIYYYQKAVAYDRNNTRAHEKMIVACAKRDVKEKQISLRYHTAMEYYRKGLKDKAVDELVIAIKEESQNKQIRLKLAEIENSK